MLGTYPLLKLYSITRSARTSTDGGIVKPRVGIPLARLAFREYLAALGARLKS